MTDTADFCESLASTKLWPIVEAMICFDRSDDYEQGILLELAELAKRAKGQVAGECHANGN